MKLLYANLNLKVFVELLLLCASMY